MFNDAFQGSAGVEDVVHNEDVFPFEVQFQIPWEIDCSGACGSVVGAGWEGVHSDREVDMPREVRDEDGGAVGYRDDGEGLPGVIGGYFLA